MIVSLEALTVSVVVRCLSACTARTLLHILIAAYIHTAD